MLAAVDPNDAVIQEVKSAAKPNEPLTHLADDRTVIVTKISKGLNLHRKQLAGA